MTSNHVLVVDDEVGVRESMRMLLKGTYAVSLATCGQDALARFPEVRPDVVLLDLRMPDMNGIEVLQRLKTMDPYVEVILVTAYATVDTARKALRLGAFDYITKPFNPSELSGIVHRAIEHRDDSLRRSAKLEAIEQDYASLRQEIEQAKYRIATQVRETIYALMMSLEFRDAYSGQHSMAVLWLVDAFAEFLRLSTDDRLHLRRAALVHDLGKIGIPEEILNKPGPLSPSDWAAMKNHPILSAEIIGNVEALAELVPVVRAHHERWDGNGYPAGLSGMGIPRFAQILAVCDTLHAMSSNRCYRARLPEAVIRRELQNQSGRQFNPEFVEAILASTLISDISLAESTGQLAFTTQQIRQVLEDSDVREAGDAALRIP
ncbi:MAG TPA: response regulator [Armatimonadota bacterium]|nr:response regulator [Armatimonadota bacterium]